MTPDIELRIRRFLWLNHGHGNVVYGDDGEMQCPVCDPYDFRRAPLEQVVGAAEEALFESRLVALMEQQHYG